MVAALLVYIFTAMKVVHHHESAFTLLYGQNLLEHHGLYSGTFMGREAAYTTWALVAAAMVKLFGVTLLAHAMTSALFVVFVAGVVVFFCRVACVSILPAVFLGTLVFINFNLKHQPYRWFDQVWLWPMNSYGIYDFLSMLYLLLAYVLVVGKSVNETHPSPDDFLGMISWKRALGFWLVTMVLSLNSIRGLMTIILPVLMALVVEFVYRQNFNVPRLRRAMWALAPAVVGLVLGMLLHKIGTQDSFQPTQQIHTVFATPNISIRLWQFWERWYELFDALPQTGLPIFNLAGLIIVAKFLFASILFFAPIFYARRIAQCGTFYRLVLYKHFAILFVVYFAYLYGTSHQERYLIPVAISSFFVFVLLLNSWIVRKEWNNFFVASLFIIIPYYSAMNFYVEESVRYIKNPELAINNNQNYRLTKFLLQNGLSHGFSSNWTTNQLTVRMYSGGRVDLGLIDDDTFTPHWHGDMGWYRPRNIASSFLVVNDDDLQTQFWPQYLVTKYHPKALRFENKSIYIFDFDLNSILNDLSHVLNCKEHVNVVNSGLFASVQLAPTIPGKGALGCKGWGQIRKSGTSYARELNAHGVIYLSAKPGPNLVHVSAGSMLPSCGMSKCGEVTGKGVVIFRGATKVAEQYFEKGIQDFVFKDNISAGNSMVEYVLMPQGEGVIVKGMSIQLDMEKNRFKKIN